MYSFISTNNAVWKTIRQQECQEIQSPCRDLKSLYEEIVKTGLVSDADFWRSRQDLVMRKAGSAGGKQQVVGLSSALLAQIQPGNDGKGKQVDWQPPQLQEAWSIA